MPGEPASRNPVPAAAQTAAARMTATGRTTHLPLFLADPAASWSAMSGTESFDGLLIGTPSSLGYLYGDASLIRMN